MALKITHNKNVKFTIIKTRTGCQYAGYFCSSENVNWAAQNPPLGHAARGPRVWHGWPKVMEWQTACGLWSLYPTFSSLAI